MCNAHDAVRDCECETEIAECGWHRQRRHEQRGHRREQHDAHCTVVGIDDARQPRVPDPRPPQEAEDDESVRDAAPGCVVRHERAALRDRQDEDEIEEQLEWAHGVAVSARDTDSRCT